MSTSRPRRLMVATAVAAVTALVPVATADAAATTVTACVKTRTGAVKVLPVKKVKSKCSKGWKKVTWNLAGKPGKNGTNGTNGAPGAPGATGATGPAGPLLNVKDANGTVIGQFAGYYFTGSFPIPQVLFQGGLYLYYPSGQLLPTGMSGSNAANFKTADCTGTAYLQGGGIPPQLLAGFVGSGWRLVNRTVTPPMTFNPATAWKLTNTTEDVIIPKQLYKQDTSGTCSTDGAPYTGTLITLEQTPAPPDGVGPLTVG